MNTSVIALFGEAQKGKLEQAYYCQSLRELFEYLGEPPEDAQGLFFAIQTLLFGKPLLYFRVRQEGVSLQDYHYGLQLLNELKPSFIHLQALCLPRCSSSQVIDESITLCKKKGSLLIVQEADFYDYMTDPHL